MISGDLFTALINADGAEPGVWVAILRNGGEQFALVTGMHGKENKVWGDWWRPGAKRDQCGFLPADPFEVGLDDVRLATPDEAEYIRRQGAKS